MTDKKKTKTERAIAALQGKSSAKPDEIMRGDDYANVMTGLGGPPDKGQYTSFQEQPRLQSQELNIWYEQDALAARLIDRLPDDATREGFKLTGADEKFDWNSVMSEFEDLDALNAVADSWRWARLQGGSILVMAINDGRKYDKALDLSKARRLTGIQVVESTFVQPEGFVAGLGSRSFRLPTHYIIRGAHGSERLRKVHRSRVIRLDGMKVSPSFRIQNDGWGPSILQRVSTQLRQLGEVMGYSRSIAHNISIPVMHFKGLRAALCGDAKTQAQTQRMFETIRLTMDNLHMLALDSEDKLGEASRDVSGLEKLIEKFVDGLVRSTDMPRTVLLGEQPGGLGSNAASEIRSWYDHVHAQQRLVLTPVINRLLEVMLAIRANRGEQVPFEWQVEWNQLWQPTALEKSQTDLALAQTRQIYFSIGGMSSGEIRVKLEEEGQIEDASDSVPPPPVAVNTGSPPGGSLELASADADPLTAPPSSAPMPDDLLSVREAAQRFGIPTRTLSLKCERNELAFWKFGGRTVVSLAEVAALGHSPAVDKLDAPAKEGLGQGFPKARAEALEQKYGRLNEIALGVAQRKVIPAIISGSDGAVEDAIDAVQEEVDLRFGDDVVEGLAEEAGESLTEEHGNVFFAALGVAIGAKIVGGDSDTEGIPRGPVLPPPGVAGATGGIPSRGVLGVRINLDPQLFASEFTTESVALIGELRAGIREGLSDAIVRAKQFGGTPEETADRLLKIWEKNGVPSKLPIDRFKNNGERVLISTEKHARLVAHDQVNKLNGKLNQTRQEAAGITNFIWRTQGDDRVREAHEAINGQTFKWAEGAPIEGLPGEPINCRCHGEPVVDKDEIELSGDFVEL